MLAPFEAERDFQISRHVSRGLEVFQPRCRSRKHLETDLAAGRMRYGKLRFTVVEVCPTPRSLLEWPRPLRWHCQSSKEDSSFTAHQRHGGYGMPMLRSFQISYSSCMTRRQRSKRCNASTQTYATKLAVSSAHSASQSPLFAASTSSTSYASRNL
jgi:hypothetical protein